MQKYFYEHLLSKNEIYQEMMKTPEYFRMITSKDYLKNVPQRLTDQEIYSFEIEPSKQIDAFEQDKWSPDQDHQQYTPVTEHEAEKIMHIPTEVDFTNQRINELIQQQRVPNDDGDITDGGSEFSDSDNEHDNQHYKHHKDTQSDTSNYHEHKDYYNSDSEVSETSYNSCQSNTSNIGTIVNNDGEELHTLSVRSMPVIDTYATSRRKAGTSYYDIKEPTITVRINKVTEKRITRSIAKTNIIHHHRRSTTRTISIRSTTCRSTTRTANIRGTNRAINRIINKTTTYGRNRTRKHNTKRNPNNIDNKQ
jgi:hypothetical protein